MASPSRPAAAAETNHLRFTVPRRPARRGARELTKMMYDNPLVFLVTRRHEKRAVKQPKAHRTSRAADHG